MLANQVDDSTEVMKSGNSFCLFFLLFKCNRNRANGCSISSYSIPSLMVYSRCLFNFRFMGFAVLFIGMHFNAIFEISIVEPCSDCIITVLCIVITALFNTSLDFHHATDDRFLLLLLFFGYVSRNNWHRSICINVKYEPIFNQTKKNYICLYIAHFLRLMPHNKF